MDLAQTEGSFRRGAFGDHLIPFIVPEHRRGSLAIPRLEPTVALPGDAIGGLVHSLEFLSILGDQNEA